MLSNKLLADPVTRVHVQLLFGFIPPKANRNWKNALSPFLNPNRNPIERKFCIAARYDRKIRRGPASRRPSATGYVAGAYNRHRTIVRPDMCEAAFQPLVAAVPP